MKKKGNIVSTILPAITIGLVLIIGLIVFGMFENSTRDMSVFSSAATTEELGKIGNYTLTNTPMYTQYAPTFITNESVSLTSANYSITNWESGSIRILGLADINQKVNITYKYLTGSAWTSVDKTRGNTYTGFNLGSILPLVIFAMVILTVILGVFVMRN